MEAKQADADSRIALTLLSLVAAASLGHVVTGQTTSSCLHPAGCKNVSISAYPLACQSPFYEQLLSATGDTCQLDNVCITMYAFDNNTVLYIRSAVYNNGTNLIGRFIHSGLPGYPGVFKVQGVRDSSGCKECFYTDYYLGSPCDEVYVLYRCLVYGYCTQLYNEQDNRVGLSTHRRPRVPSCCFPRMEALATSQPALSGSQFVRLPNLLPRRCVTSFNGASCINACSVAAGDSISLPCTNGCLS